MVVRRLADKGKFKMIEELTDWPRMKAMTICSFPSLPTPGGFYPGHTRRFWHLAGGLLMNWWIIPVMAITPG
jgi:hypothetical protein